MDFLITFLLGFIFSFIGSIPPGLINISVLQLSIKGHLNAALRFALAATIVEFVYAYLAIRFELLITSSQIIQDNFHVISASVLILLGIINLINRKRPGKLVGKLEMSGFRKGILISIANPLAIPFWIAITAYLQSNGWLVLTKTNQFIYITGLALGTLALLSLLAFLSSRVSHLMQGRSLVKKIPGIVLLSLGIYSLLEYVINYIAR